MTHTIVGLFSNRSEAQTAMQELVQQGFIQDSIDLSNRNTATNTTAATAGATDNNQGIGDRIGNFFNSLFDDETTASNYTNAAYDADAILTVQVDSEERARQASEILDRNGAMDIDAHNNAQYSGAASNTSYNEQNFAGTAADTTATSTTNVENQTVIPVVEEELQVGKRAVERGGARIRSRIIEKPVEANVRLREEHVVINRRPVNRAVTDADINNLQEGDIELTERAEVPVIGKQARIVEEIEVSKTVEERQETVRDTVRHTDVDVQEINSDVTATTTTETNNIHPETRKATN